MSTSLDLSKLSLMDALDLAILIEEEARQRYELFAKQLGRTGGYDAGAFFASMVENEAKHGTELLERRIALFGKTPMKLKLHDIYDIEAPDTGAPRRGMSTLQAFEVGLSSEKKAYDFYDMASLIMSMCSASSSRSSVNSSLTSGLVTPGKAMS